jgi:4-amino-4-deoxy-L-arabinose transferase-like glycosyltransferase
LPSKPPPAAPSARLSAESPSIAGAGHLPRATGTASARPASLEAASIVTRRTWIAVALVVALVWFANLGTRALLHPDEGRYAEIAREMTVSGDWVTPRLDGLKYFEKPPLQYWLTALSFEAFGVDEWSARLPGALAGFLTVAVVAVVGSVVASPAAGLFGAAALAGSVWLFAMAHIVTLDALLTFWLTLALGAFLLARHAGASPVLERRWMLVAWAATAGGVLTKGLVALLIPFCTLVVYTLATRDRSPWQGLHIGRGLVVLLVLAAPWFVLVSARNPEFARFFFIHEHFERFLTTEHRRPGAWWYFLPMLLVGLLPWTGLFAWRAGSGWRAAPADARGFAWARFCLAWAAFVLVFFSLSGSKLPSYILPIFPAAALVLGRQLEDVPTRTLATFTAVLVATTTMLWMGVMIGWPRIADAFAEPRTPRALFDALGPFVKLALGIATASYVLGWLVLRRGGAQARTAGVLALAVGTMLAMQTGFAGSDVFRATRSSVDLVAALEKAHDPPYDRNAPFFQVRMYDQTLPFYLGRTTTLVEYRDELALGLDAEPERGIPRVAQWTLRWRALPQAYALMSPDTHDALAAEGVPMRVITTDPRRLLVARR